MSRLERDIDIARDFLLVLNKLDIDSMSLLNMKVSKTWWYKNLPAEERVIDECF